jgi:hypothetical protein
MKIDYVMDNALLSKLCIYLVIANITVIGFVIYIYLKLRNKQGPPGPPGPQGPPGQSAPVVRDTAPVSAPVTATTPSPSPVK